MSEANIEKLVDTLSQMTVLEMSQLKKALEEAWGVEAAAAAVVAAPAAGDGEAAPAAEAATDFQVTLTEVPADKKIAIIKLVREITGLGLKEAKEMVENTPKVLKESAPKAEADEISKKVSEAGGKVTLKGV